MTARVPAVAAVVAALLVGCGYKGPLTLPEKPGPVIIRPAPTAPPAGAPATKPEETQPTTPPPPTTAGSPPSG
jgi:hypothetical protein